MIAARISHETHLQSLYRDGLKMDPDLVGRWGWGCDARAAACGGQSAYGRRLCKLCSVAHECECERESWRALMLTLQERARAWDDLPLSWQWR